MAAEDAIACEKIGAATLYLGDCLQVLPGLERVAHVVTDPPYEAEAHAAGRRLLGSQRDGRRTVQMAPLDFAQITQAERETAAQLMAAICDGWLLTFCQAEAVALWRDAHCGGGARYMRAMVWIKPDGAPQFTGDRPGMGYESIVASWCGEGRSKWNGGGRRGVFTCPQRDGNHPKLHLTQKPLRLMRELIGLFTEPGQAVLDAYMGSGTTGVAALECGRAFVGIERDPRHFTTACRRIEQSLKQQTLQWEGAIA
jgi:site-specific DNA-methyltransferase (adenine-specific)